MGISVGEYVYVCVCQEEEEEEEKKNEEQRKDTNDQYSSHAPRNLIRRRRMQHHLIRVLRRVPAHRLRPVIADGVREHFPITVEVGGRDGPADLGVSLEFSFLHRVPEVEGAVGPGGGEDAVHRVDGDAVDGVCLGFAIDCLPRAFEGVVAAGVLADEHDGAAAFDAAARERVRRGEAGEGASLEAETGHFRLENRVWFAEVDDVEVAIGGTDDKHLVARRHCRHSVLALHCRQRRRRAQIPVLHRLVPGPRHEQRLRRVSGVKNHFAAADGLVVRGDLNRR